MEPKEPQHYKHSAYQQQQHPPPSDGETPIQTVQIPVSFREVMAFMQDRYVNHFNRFLCGAQYPPHVSQLTVKAPLDKSTVESHATGCGTLPRPVHEGTTHQWNRSMRRPQPAMQAVGER